MKLPMDAEKPPFRVNADGKALMDGSRVSIDRVLAYFNGGHSPDEIVERFDTLSRADVYSVIAYYLRNKDVVDAYLAERELMADELQALIEGGVSADEIVAHARGQRSVA